MSKLARSYSDKHGLKDLIKEFTGNDINKYRHLILVGINRKTINLLCKRRCLFT